MKTCNKNHNEIIFSTDLCPVCDANQEIAKIRLDLDSVMRKEFPGISDNSRLLRLLSQRDVRTIFTIESKTRKLNCTIYPDDIAHFLEFLDKLENVVRTPKKKNEKT